MMSARLLRRSAAVGNNFFLRPFISSSFSSIPPITSKSNNAPPERIAEAKRLLVDPIIPRSRRGGGGGGRTNNINNAEVSSSLTLPFPTYSGLPVDDSSPNPRDVATTPNGYKLYPSKYRYATGVSPADMPFVHFRPDEDFMNSRPKFRNPRKRASKLFSELTRECIEKSIASKPQVWEVPFRVGDAVELEILEDGGVDNPNNKRLDVVRGVVLGRENKGLDASIYLKDVLYGEHVERKIKLHSPTVKSLKVLEAGFVNRGKKKGRRVKRAKLYYLRDRGMEGES
jgi:ribosomal protein L19